MSEMMTVTIRFKIRPEWFLDDGHTPSPLCPPAIVDLIDDAINDWGEGVTHGGHEFEVGGEMNYGFSGHGHEEALAEAGIAFVGHTEAKYEYDGDVNWWTPDGGHGSRPADQGGGPMLGRMEYEALLKQHREDGLIDALDAFFVNPWELLDKAPLPPIYEPEEA